MDLQSIRQHYLTRAAGTFAAALVTEDENLMFYLRETTDLNAYKIHIQDVYEKVARRGYKGLLIGIAKPGGEFVSSGKLQCNAPLVSRNEPRQTLFSLGPRINVTAHYVPRSDIWRLKDFEIDFGSEDIPFCDPCLDSYCHVAKTTIHVCEYLEGLAVHKERLASEQVNSQQEQESLTHMFDLMVLSTCKEKLDPLFQKLN